jgi:hypothetical protein
MEPAFVLVGAAKSGTTALHRYLEAHPDVEGPLWKEIRYFDERYHRGPAWYRAHFPPRSEGQRITFDGTVGYLYHPQAAERMARELPHARVVAMVRNPVDRAVSQYLHEVRRGWERRPAREAFEAHLALAEQDGIEEPRRRGALVEPDGWLGYVRRGVYLPQLERYFAAFGRDRVHVIKYEGFFASPESGYRRLLELLELAPDPDVRFERHNVGSYPKQLDFDRDRLVEFFRPYNLALEDRLGLDLSDWT